MKVKDLTYGAILKNLLIIALPLTITNVINMAYNLTDMFWVGQLDYQAVTAIGTAGLFLWLAYGFFQFASSGTQIKVSHAVGEKNYDDVRYYAITGLKIAAIVGLTYAVVIFFFKDFAIDIFGLKTLETANRAKSYLSIVSFAVIFQAINTTYVSIFNGVGNSKMVLIISSSGLVVNMILDPLLIHGLGMGVSGAAWATLLASTVPTMIFTYYAFTKIKIFDEFNLLRIRKTYARVILKLSVPTAVQSLFFTGIAMYISGKTIMFGEDAMAVQRIGSQIESLTWMIGIGANIAISVFVGQNFAAGKWRRLIKGYTLMMAIMSVYGLLVSLLLYTSGYFLFDIFLNETFVIELGEKYLKVLALSQLGMMFETICSGTFYGLGKTYIPSAISIIGNALRVPLLLIMTPAMGVYGIWWAITLSSIFKGSAGLIMFAIHAVKNENIKFKYFVERYKPDLEVA
jgi:putative MATE family efflux protein